MPKKQKDPGNWFHTFSFVPSVTFIIQKRENAQVKRF